MPQPSCFLDTAAAPPYERRRFLLPSSSGQGHRPLTPETRVRLPLGVPFEAALGSRSAGFFFFNGPQPTPGGSEGTRTRTGGGSAPPRARASSPGRRRARSQGRPQGLSHGFPSSSPHPMLPAEVCGETGSTSFGMLSHRHLHGYGEARFVASDGVHVAAGPHPRPCSWEGAPNRRSVGRRLTRAHLVGPRGDREDLAARHRAQPTQRQRFGPGPHVGTRPVRSRRRQGPLPEPSCCSPRSSCCSPRGLTR